MRDAHSESKSLTAVVPVKAHSSRLPGKNLLPFGGTNLLLHKIEQLKQVEEVDDIVVSSDSDEMLKMAEEAGVTALKRPKEYADESVPFGMFLEYLSNILPNDHVMWACVTSPLVEPWLYRRAIKLYFEGLEGEFDSLITVEPMRTYFMDEDGPLNFETGLAHKNSERLNPVYHFTNGINIAPKKKLAEWHYNYGSNPYRLMVGKREAVDIDDAYDYACALAMAELPADGKPVDPADIARRLGGGAIRNLKVNRLAKFFRLPDGRTA